MGHEQIFSTLITMELSFSKLSNMQAGLKIIQSYILRQYSLTWKSIDKTGNFHLKGDCVQSGWYVNHLVSTILIARCIRSHLAKLILF